MADYLRLANDSFLAGDYAEALRLAQQAKPRKKAETADRDCLICECLQYAGQADEALDIATRALESEPRPAIASRYWQVVGRVHLDQLRREQAAGAFLKAIRAGEKSNDSTTLAWAQQLWLVALGETLGSGLAPAVREAFHTAVRTANGAVLAGFHIRLCRLEGQRGDFEFALHHLSLAKSLLDRCPHTALQALYHVNRACVLATIGVYAEARRDAELGCMLAEKAGHLRLSMAGAATASYIAISAGDLHVAETWIKKARTTADLIGPTEIGLLDSQAILAMIQGDFESAREFIAQAKRSLQAEDVRWLSGTEIMCLFTELELHRRLGERDKAAATLATIRGAVAILKDQHSDQLASLADIETQYENGHFQAAGENLRAALKCASQHPFYLAPVSRIVARLLWLEGRTASSRRRLLRASANSFSSGTRIQWADAFREAHSVARKEPYADAYSLDRQARHARTKFSKLVTDINSSWFTRTVPHDELPLDPLDGFDEATTLLSLGPDPVIKAREVLASLVALDAVEGGAVILRADSGIKTLASVKWSVGDTNKALKQSLDFDCLEVGQIAGQTVAVLVRERRNVRAISAVSGLRRLLEAASAVESQKKHQQRMGALWQPEDIVEEPGAVFSSSKMIELMLTARKVAGTRLPVLLLGPTGTGKEIVARAIHRASPRANKVFLAFNCSAVPRDMVESQLFGYRRGSFTGATDDFPGIIRAAEGGTLFLDEIGELSYDLQPKLLRFLETSEVHPLGEKLPIKVDVRIVAATNANLDDLIDRKAFREDLYYRLNIVRFHLPSLGERREEIPALVTHLLREIQIEAQKHGIKVSDEVMEYLLLYKWPGNIRQLVNELRRMVAMVENNDTLLAEHLAPAIRRTRRTIAVNADADAAGAPAATPARTTPPATAAASGATPAENVTLPLEQPLHTAVDALERAMIEHAIARSGGKVEEAARLLGISRKGLFLKRRRWMGGDDTPSNDR